MRRFTLVFFSTLALAACGSDDGGGGGGVVLFDAGPDANGGGGGDGDGGGSSTATSFQERLIECGVLTDTGDFSIDPDACFTDCYLDADCADIELIACGGGDVSPALAGCFDACVAAMPKFTCTDGTPDILAVWECDGDNDCADASDEAGCNTTSCDGGDVMYVDSWKCDGIVDCMDETDEADCTGFTCGDGKVIPAGWQCDVAEDCADLSDEAGCATTVCAAM